MSSPKRAKIGTLREAPSLSELFDRRARTQDMWGKEPIEYQRLFDVEQNTLKHRESGLQVWRGFADLVNRTDKRYPDSRDNVCVFFWTSKADLPKWLKVGQNNAIWSDILLKLCKVHKEEVMDDEGEMSATLPAAGGAQKKSHESSTTTKASMSSLQSATSSLGEMGGGEAKHFLCEFLSLEPEEIHQMAIKNDVRPFNDKEGYAHPTKVQLVELMTGRAYRDCLRDGSVAQFEIAIPVYVPAKMLTRSRDGYGSAKFPHILNIAISEYDPFPTTFWNDRLVDAAAAGDPAKLTLCFEKGASLNHQDCRGWTALHAVANILHDRAFRDGNRKKQVLDILLPRKPNMHIRTLRGELAVDLAEFRGFALCADVLRSEYHVPIKDAEILHKTPDAPLAVALRERLLF
mmetsp:Transcript_10739/g.26311  ORF Transcript_10739/g.26311 Transcript_10739/m.26311 type:complete len:404 (+) Transcript_10739:115-1326(+)|eukprot:CAMPEP_0179000072 /NCGR_PEP_ID=MMETSP0795-20121207/10454_1 /TAXON_ID=88552 /ORGANISM="Amoebophrya sp., Strain Ameob2" /LENGTH=403 /DNA_ID=CAMNT_0020692999 /DNA_START=56 /DNA_END=1267 /DNA_ORIENTATION=+